MWWLLMYDFEVCMLGWRIAYFHDVKMPKESNSSVLLIKYHKSLLLTIEDVILNLFFKVNLKKVKDLSEVYN